MLGRRGNEPFTFADVLSDYSAAYDDGATHDDLTSAFGALLHDGAIARVGDMPGQTRRATRYVLRGADRSTDCDAELMDAIVAIVEAGYRTTGGPLPTSAVRQALRKQNLWPDRFGRLHRLLSRLAGVSRRATNGRQQGNDAPLRQASGMATSGTTAAFWLPRWAPDQCAITPATATDALRRAIMAAGSALTRPVSKSEIGVWLESQPGESPIRSTMAPGQVSSLLRNLRFRDAGEARHGRLHVVAGPLTCYGGCQERYACDPASDDEIALCALLDAMHVVRPARELAALTRLRRHLRADPGTANALVGLRTTALAQALTFYAGNLEVEALTAIAGRALHGIEELRRWLGRSANPPGVRRRRERAAMALAADIDASLTIYRNVNRIEWDRVALGVVGQVAMEELARLRRLAAREIARGVVSASRVHLAYRSARRFPVDDASGSMEADARALVDRVDAMAELYGRAVDPAVRADVRAAHTLLGHVLRDAGALEHLEMSAGDATTRRTLRRAQQLLTPGDQIRRGG